MSDHSGTPSASPREREPLKPNPLDYLRLLVGRVEHALSHLEVSTTRLQNSHREGHVTALIEADELALVQLWLRDTRTYIPVIEGGLRAAECTAANELVANDPNVLKPCPFCGGDVMVREGDGPISQYTIYCRCDAAPTVVMRLPSQAKRIWNTRVPASRSSGIPTGSQSSATDDCVRMTRLAAMQLADAIDHVLRFYPVSRACANDETADLTALATLRSSASRLREGSPA